MLHVQCPGCGAFVLTTNGADPDSELVCACCPEDHHHGEAANSCPRTHDGDCGKDVDGCTVCRPLVITLPRGSIDLQIGG